MSGTRVGLFLSATFILILLLTFNLSYWASMERSFSSLRSSPKASSSSVVLNLSNSSVKVLLEVVEELERKIRQELVSLKSSSEERHSLDERPGLKLNKSKLDQSGKVRVLIQTMAR